MELKDISDLVCKQKTLSSKRALGPFFIEKIFIFKQQNSI